MKDIIFALYAITPIAGIVASTILAFTDTTDFWGFPAIAGGVVGIVSYIIKHDQ